MKKCVNLCSNNRFYMKKNLHLLPLVIVVAAILAAAVALLTYENDLLWKAQELNLFLYTGNFLKEQMVVPGGLLTWASTWCTQFFYHPWVGIALLALLWVALAALTVKTFSIPYKWASLALVPLALLLLSDVTLDYWIYYLKLRGAFFAATLGTLFAVAMVWVFIHTTHKYFINMLLIMLTVVVGYPLMGFYALLAAALMIIVAWRQDMPIMRKTLCGVVGLLVLLAVPLVCYRYVYNQTSIVNVWWAGLPLFQYVEEYSAYYLPYYGLVAFYVAAAVTYKKRNAKMPVAKVALWAAAQCGIVAVVVAAVAHFWYKDSNYHKELAMMRAVEQLDWEKVVDEAKNLDDEPTRAILMMKNLALYRLGRLGDEMYQYGNGSKKPATPITVRMMQVVGRTLYFNYGLANYSYRWCMEDGVEFGWRAEYLKDMARCCIVNGEWKLARKYINILKDTKYHKEWAVEHEKLVGNMAAVKKSKELGPVTKLMNYTDMLNSDNSIVEQFLMRHLLTLDSNDNFVQEAALHGALWSKDIANFWMKFFRYSETMKGKHMPIHYQEAAYLYGHLENKVDISKMPFDKEVVNTFNNFMERSKQLGSRGYTEDMMKESMRAEFGHTFYYEYFLNRNQQLY